MGVSYDYGARMPADAAHAGFQSVQVRLEQPVYFRGPEKRLWELTLAEASAVIYRNEIATPAEMNGMLDELRALAEDESVLIAQWLSPGIIARK